MKTKVITTIMITLFLASMLSMAFNVEPVSATAVTDVYVSDESDLWWSGATQARIDVSGYIIPPDGTWQSAVFCWEHPSWNGMLNPADRKAKLFETPSADWIWKAYEVTTGESYTGDIVFFKKLISIPDNAFNIEADFFVITADNVYYFYVNDGWSGEPDGKANFAPGYGPTSFYYVADGTDKSGGTNSVPYETVGNLYPLEASMGWPQAGDEQWWNIELWGISDSLHTGDNWLQIVAINEHAPPSDGETNPAGLIYKVEVTYELATIEKTLSSSEGELGDVVTVTLDVEVPTGYTMTVKDEFPSELSYVPGTFMVDGNPVTPTVADGVISTSIGEGDHVITFGLRVMKAYACTDKTVTNTAKLYHGENLLDDDSEDFTILCYPGLYKTATLVDEASVNGYVELNEKVTYDIEVYVHNAWDYGDWSSTVVYDRFGAELMLDKIVYDEYAVYFTYYNYITKNAKVDVGTTPGGNNIKDDHPLSRTEPLVIPFPDTPELTIRWKGKSWQVEYMWEIGALGVCEDAEIHFFVSTDWNPAGKQEYTSLCLHEINSAATLKFLDTTGTQFSVVTGSLDQYYYNAELRDNCVVCIKTVRYPATGNVYIGYEDWPNGDFDYNNFGMTFSAEETYDCNWYLLMVKMKFTAVIYDSGAEHDIHITRPIVGTSTYTVTRSIPYFGHETPAGTYSGSGPIDVILFDTSKYAWPSKQIDEWVEIVIYVGDPASNPKTALPPPRTITNGGVTFTDLDPFMANYDPWMRAYLPFAPGTVDWHIGSVMSVTGVSGAYSYLLDSRLIDLNLPHILVVPFTDWIPPYEDTSMSRPPGQHTTPSGSPHPDWGPYNEFYDFYSTGDSAYADWYETITNNYVGRGGISWAAP